MVHHVIDPSRLTRTWFQRRAAWQAVSDFIKDPQRMAAYAPAAIEHLRRDLDATHGPAACFFDATEEPRQFERDVGTMYNLVVSMLAGGEELDGTSRLHREDARAQF